MSKKMNLGDLCKAVNSEIEINKSEFTSSFSDKRTKLLFTERRIRDLISKGFIPAGIKEKGSSALFYGQAHIDALLDFKKGQAQGLSEQHFKLQKNSTLTQSSSLSNAISDIETRSSGYKDQSNLFGASSIGSSLNDASSEEGLNALPMRTVLYSMDKTSAPDIPIVEKKSYQISNNIELNISSSVTEEELDQLQSSIENIIKLYK